MSEMGTVLTDQEIEESMAFQRACVANPRLFFEDVLGSHFYPRQWEIPEAIVDRGRIAVCGANGTGKDYATGRIVHYWEQTRTPAKTVVIGPTHRQVSDIVWKETRTSYRNSLSDLGGRLLPSASRWELNDEHFAVGFATNGELNIQGYHSPHLLVIITEAHNVDQGHIESVLRLNPSCIIMTGNPLCEGGEFYEAFHSKADRWTTIQLSAFDTPNVQEGREIYPGVVTIEDVEEKKADWGEGSPLYIASVLGEFPDNLEDVVVTRKHVAEAIGRTLEPGQEDRIIFGVDVARFGDDRSVIYRREGPVARKIWDVQGRDTMAVAGKVGTLLDAEPSALAVIDVVGVGAGVYDRCKENGDRVRAFNGGGNARRKERYVNAISEAWIMAGKAFANGVVDLDDNRKVMSELCARRTAVQGDKRWRIEKKEDYKKRIGRSPDDADALCMCYSPLVDTDSIGGLY